MISPTNVINRTHVRFELLFALFVVWQLAGIFPAMSYEGDALSISSGCEYTFSHGWHTLGEKGYGYWMQPLTYIVIVGLKHLFTTAGCEQIYCIASSISAIAMQLLIILFASRVCGIRREICLLALALLPESYMLAMYPNSASFSGLIYMGGVLLLLDRRLIAGTILLAMAPLFRLDVLMVFPAIPLILKISDYTWKRSLTLSAIYAVGLSVFLLCAYSLLRADIFHTADEHSRWGDIVPIRKNVMAILGFYGLPSIGLLIASLVKTKQILGRKKGATILILCWGMILLVHIVQFRFGNASKHFATLIPFVVILTAYSLNWLIFHCNKGLKIAFLAFILIFEMTGLRLGAGKRIISQSLLNDYNPTLAEFNFRIGDNPTSIVFGGGQAAMTADEAILTSGNLFYPFFVHTLKEENLEYRKNVIKEIKKNENAQVIYAAWEELATLDLLATEGKIEGGHLSQDVQLFSYIQEIENPRKREEMASYVKKEYGFRPNATLFVSTESTSHRWRNTLRLLADEGIIEPADKSGAVYRISQR